MKTEEYSFRLLRFPEPRARQPAGEMCLGPVRHSALKPRPPFWHRHKWLDDGRLLAGLPESTDNPRVWVCGCGAFRFGVILR